MPQALHVRQVMVVRHQNHLLRVIARMALAAEAHPIQVHVAFAQANKETKKC